jgi:hypothetical protein
MKGPRRVTSRVALLTIAAAAILTTGCARRVPVAALEDGGAHVGVVVVLASGESINARLLSFSPEGMELETYHPIGGAVTLQGTGSDARLERRGKRIPGELVSVERGDGNSRTAIVRRTVPLDDVSSATFHRSGSEASLGPVLSLFIGPVVGALLALAI